MFVFNKANANARAWEGRPPHPASESKKFGYMASTFIPQRNRVAAKSIAAVLTLSVEPVARPDAVTAELSDFCFQAPYSGQKKGGKEILW